MYAKEQYLTMEVIHKPTGEKRWIVCERFNPALHEKFAGGKFGSNETVVRVSPGPNVLDLSYLSKKIEKIEEPEAIAEPPVEEPKLEVSEEEKSLESLTMSKIRGIAKEKGIKFLPSTKKIELIALIRAST